MTEPADDDLQQRIDGASNVLLRRPSTRRPVAAHCAELLSAPGRTNVLIVALTESHEDWAFWDEHLGQTEPAVMGVVTVGTGPESAEVGDGSLLVERIAGPGDLTGLGMAVSRMLQTWQDNGNHSVVCFQSVTTLLKHVELERVFRFLHLLTRRVDAAGAVAHYHLDSRAHDEPTIATLIGLFDVVV